MSLITICSYALQANADDISDLIPHIIQAESGGRSDVVSKAGAIGICQVTDIVLQEWNDNLWKDKWAFGGGFDNDAQKQKWINEYEEACPIEKSHGHNAEYPNASEARKETAERIFIYHVKSDLFDRAVNLKISEWYLRRLKDHYLKDVRIVPLLGSVGEMHPMDIFKDFENTRVVNRKYHLEIIYGHGYTKEPFEYTRVVINDLNLPSYERAIELFNNHRHDKAISKKLAEELELCLVLGMYNWGLGNVKGVNYDINRFPKSTRKYIKDIMKALKKEKE